MKKRVQWLSFPKELKIRYTTVDDHSYLLQWLKKPGILRNFPVKEQWEVEQTVDVWMEFAKHRLSITATWNDVPVGIAVLYLQGFRKISHQALFAVLVEKQQRSKGIGTKLIQTLERMAKEIGLDFLHLEVYEGNRAKALYEKLGFTVVGRRKGFLLDDGQYIDQILMQKDFS